VVSLDTLAPAEAAGLLARLASRPDVIAGDPEVAQIVALCGYLPLAIGMTGRQLAHHPAWTPAGLAADLAAAKDRLELMAAENLSVAAAFGLSYEDLGDGQQRLFRRLGLHPGPDIDAYAAAALDGSGVAAARRHLEALYDQHLITEPARGRYRFHDLIREHARTLAAADDPAARDTAAARLLDYYLHTARAASGHFPSWTNAEGPAPPGRPPASAPPVSTLRQAARWLEAERANLHAAAGYAAATARPTYAVLIPAAMDGFLQTRGYWDQGLALHRAALAAARQAGDRAGPRPPRPGAGHRPRPRRAHGGSTRPGRHRPQPHPGRQPRRRRRQLAAGTHHLPAHRSPRRPARTGNPPRPSHKTGNLTRLPNGDSHQPCREASPA